MKDRLLRNAKRKSEYLETESLTCELFINVKVVVFMATNVTTVLKFNTKMFYHKQKRKVQ